MDIRELFTDIDKTLMQHIEGSVKEFKLLSKDTFEKLKDFEKRINEREKNNKKRVDENTEARIVNKTRTVTRSSRKALKETNVNAQLIKLEKKTANNVTVKKEKYSCEAMPPPTTVPKRIKEEKLSVAKYITRNSQRDTDVVVINKDVSILSISDDENTEEEKIRTTRTRGKRKQKDANNENENTASKTPQKRTKTRTKVKKEKDLENSEPKTKRPTRTKTKKTDEGDSANSDSSKNLNTSTETLNTVTRSTRTRTRAKKQNQEEKVVEECNEVQNTVVKSKRLRNSSSESITIGQEEKKEQKNKKMKTNNKDKSSHSQSSEKQEETSKESKGKDINTMDQTYNIINQTFNVQKSNAPCKANETVVIDKNNATIVLNKATLAGVQKVNNPEDLMTDDESLVEETPPVVEKPTKFKSKLKTKQIFSPFDSSPVKKRVEAFEKLKETAKTSDIPVRMTRTKKKALDKEEEETKTISAEEMNSIREKFKATTPDIKNRIIPVTFSSVSKIQNHFLHKTNHFNESLVSAKSASALKVSQNEFKERERKRREKENEALRKREALLQAQIEEKRRKREEKQIKVQQQREAIEQDKKKTIEETERLKEEKMKQVLAEKEQKQLKMKEEAQKRRMLALKKAEERKREEELRRKMEEEKQRIEEEKRKMEWRAINKSKPCDQEQPIYLTKEAPLLPTYDCYDSDEDEVTPKRKTVLEWEKSQNVREMCRAMYYAGDTIKNSFFRCTAQTPDLRKIFYKIDPYKLKRTSSAIWDNKPRYTQMIESNQA